MTQKTKHLDSSKGTKKKDKTNYNEQSFIKRTEK